MKQTSRGLAPSLNTGHSTFTGARQRLAVALVAIVIAFAGAQTARAEDIVAFGTWGTCSWEISDTGVLTVYPGEGSQSSRQSPWVYYNNQITSVVFKEVDGSKVVAPQDCRYLLKGLNLVLSVDATGLDMSHVENMSSMFEGCSALSSLDASGWNTGNVTVMNSMFYGCSKLSSLDVSGWNTGKVQYMSSMFYGCSSLSSLDVSGWNTGKVQHMSSMFEGCSSLASLDVSRWDTGKVQYIQSMFYGCSALASLDLSDWHTGNVKNMSSMFEGCSSLSSLDVSGWDTGAVVNMSSMFYGCSSLSSLDASRWDTRNVQYMGFMFSGCSALEAICVGNSWSTAAVTSSGNMFYGCGHLVGGAGTTYDSEHVDKEYARLDGEGGPGYLTRPLFVIGNTYTIYTTGGWDEFCDALQDLDTYNRFSGKTVKLGADITVSRMAGSQSHDFCGTFDGQGHTLTVNYGTAASPITEVYAAPFRFVESGCVIEKLHVSGTITTSAKCAGGIVGTQYGSVTIRNCRSSVTINSSVEGDGTHGGLVAVNNSSANLTIEGCVFDGKLLTTNGTTMCGGFIGYRNGAAEIRNSLFDPAEVTVSTDGSATFARNNVDTYNCYYTYLLCDGSHYVPGYVEATETTPAKWYNGKAACTIKAGENVTLGYDGVATEYSVSGITAYKESAQSSTFTDGILYDGVLYAGSGDAVSLTLANSGAGAPAGYQYSGGYTVSGGATLSGTTLTMADDDVIVSLALRSTRQAVSVSYINADGILCDGQDGRPAPASATALDGTEGNLYDGWYFVGADIERSDQITCFGNVHIILCDGKTMTVSGDYGIYGNEANLTIYGQTLGSGTLNASGTIGDGISTNDVGCDVTITGGTVNATSTISDGICAMGSVTITGGQVTANSIYADVSITLGWTNASDFIKVSSYSVGPNDGCPKIAVGQTLYDEDGKLYYGDWECIPEGVTLSPNVLALDDAADNSAAITASNEKSHNVILQGRTLYKDGAWNTLCLPFAMNAKEIAATPLAGADIRALSTTIVHEGAATGFDPQTGTLTLNFTPAAPASGAVNAIEPGVPYIVKWPIPDGMTADDFAAAYAANPDAYEIHDPVFSGITVRSTAPADRAVTSTDGYVTFVGTYSPELIYAAPATRLYLGADNKLYWPSTEGYTVNAFRAYFQLNNGLTCGDPTNPNAARAITLNFGDSSEAQGIGHTVITEITEKAGAWYDMQGRKLQGQPTKKGLYIHGGKKVAIK